MRVVYDPSVEQWQTFFGQQNSLQQMRVNQQGGGGGLGAILSTPIYKRQLIPLNLLVHDQSPLPIINPFTTQILAPPDANPLLHASLYHQMPPCQAPRRKKLPPTNSKRKTAKKTIIGKRLREPFLPPPPVPQQQQRQHRLADPFDKL